VWDKICTVIGKPDWISDPEYATPEARLPHLKEVFAAIEDWTTTKTKFEVMEICNPLGIPVGPILSTKEIMEDDGLRATGTIVDVDHPERGQYTTVGCPIKLSDSPVDVTRSPLLGEHTTEILQQVLGYNGEDLARVIDSGAVGQVSK
jgi:formyl-CoA transferase